MAVSEMQKLKKRQVLPGGGPASSFVQFRNGLLLFFKRSELLNPADMVGAF